MPSTIVTTTSGASSNSYVTVTECSTYFDDSLTGQEWREASEDDKARALLMAAARMERLNWRGIRASSTQVLAWPRADVQKRDGVYSRFPAWSEAFASDTVPQVIKDAQCELALAYLQGWQDGSGSRMTKVSQDGLTYEKEFAQPLGALPAKVLQMISPYIEGAKRVRA